MGNLQNNYNQPTSAQNIARAGVAASSSPTGNPRMPVSGLPTRGIILNAPELETCGTTGPRIGSDTIDFGASLGQAIADFPISLPWPVSRLWLASITNGAKNNSVMFHFSKIGNVYNSNAIIPTGNEPWIPMSSFVDPGYNNLLKFENPITNFYLDFGFESGGGGHVITLMYSDDSFDIDFFPRLAPSQ